MSQICCTLTNCAVHTFSHIEYANKEETDLDTDGDRGEFALLTTIKGLILFFFFKISYLFIDGSSLNSWYNIPCTDGSNTLYRSQFCDGYNHCTDGEDENEDICTGIIWSYLTLDRM